jgi:hypothetical protein
MDTTTLLIIVLVIVLRSLFASAVSSVLTRRDGADGRPACICRQPSVVHAKA